MPKYRVEVTYDMGMSRGGEMHEFEARNDVRAKEYIKKLKGSWLSLIKRGVSVKEETLSRVI